MCRPSIMQYLINDLEEWNEWKKKKKNGQHSLIENFVNNNQGRLYWQGLSWNTKKSCFIKYIVRH